MAKRPTSSKSRKTSNKAAGRGKLSDKEADARRTDALRPSGLKLEKETQDTRLYTTRGTPRVRRPKRSREDLDGDPNDESNRLDVKLGGRVPRELRDRFNRFVDSHASITQGEALTQAIQDFLEKHEMDQ